MLPKPDVTLASSVQVTSDRVRSRPLDVVNCSQKFFDIIFGNLKRVWSVVSRSARQGLRGTLSPSRNLSVLSTSAARLPMISLQFLQSRSQQILNPHCQAHGLKYRELTGLLPLGLSSWQSVWLPLPLWPTGFRSFLLRQTELEVRREPSGRTPLRLSHPSNLPSSLRAIIAE